MPSKIHGRKSAHREGAFSTPFRLLLVETSYISPEPKQCSECKVLCCLAHIIPQIPPFMGENMGMCAVLAQASASPSVERAYIASISYFTVHAKILCRELENVANVEVLPVPVLPVANVPKLLVWILTLRPPERSEG